MENLDIRQKILDAGLELYERGLVTRDFGCISARISNDEFLITPAQTPYAEMRPEDLVTVSINKLSYKSDKKPSSEIGIHAAVYKLHPGVSYSVHTHQNYATAFSVLGRDLTNLPEDKAALLGSTVPVSAYALSGTKSLQANVTNAMQRFLGSHAILMKSHGTICFGPTLDDAFRNAFALEKLCEDRFEEETEHEVFHLYTPEEAEDRGLISYHKGPNGLNIFAKTEILKLFAEYGKDIEIFTDDAAQLFGTKIRCLPNNADQKHILSALKIVPAVLIKDKGAVFYSSSREECEAAFMILQKNCLSSFLSEKKKQGEPLSVLLQVYEHSKYMRSHPRQK